MPQARVTTRQLLKAVNRLAGEVRQLRRDTTAAHEVIDARAALHRLALTSFRSRVFRLPQDVQLESCKRLLDRREDAADVLAWINRQPGQRISRSAFHRFSAKLREAARQLQDA